MFLLEELVLRYVGTRSTHLPNHVGFFIEDFFGTFIFLSRLAVFVILGELWVNFYGRIILDALAFKKEILNLTILQTHWTAILLRFYERINNL